MEVQKTNGTKSWTSRVVRQSGELPPRATVYGQPGVGKSTFGASLPKPVIIDFDKGADQLAVDRIPGPSSWDDSIELIRSIGRDPSGYKSLVIDTVDPLEELAIAHVCQKAKKETLGDFDFGDGYHALAAVWRLFLAELDQVRSKGLIVCLLGHSMVREALDPQIGKFDEFTVQLQKKTWAVTHRWSDLVAFATFDSVPVKGEKRSIVTGERILYTTKGSGFAAKNRYGMPNKLPLSWAAVEGAIQAFHNKPEDVQARIEALAKGTPYAEKAAEFIKGAAGDVRQLLQTEAALKEKLEAKS